MTWPFDPLTPMKYGAILADPPWAYAMRSAKGHGRSPEAHYATMTEAELAGLPVGQLAGPDCLLFLRSTWPHLPQALRLMQRWGFTYITGGSWTKRTKAFAPAMGTGYVLRSATEPFLVGRFGAPETASRSVRNLIEAEEVPDGIESIRREHSRKPPEMRAMIEALLPRAFACELFAREPWPGHEVWGNQTARFDDGPLAANPVGVNGWADPVVKTATGPIGKHADEMGLPRHGVQPRPVDDTRTGQCLSVNRAAQ